ncbi:hypothetical protein [Lapillicoccus jejuensis]|uniref:hypothetical protein n=1 Tax=Lapillicoccus jejuensis TaxID=402171 RepID=UPI0031D8DD86
MLLLPTARRPRLPSPRPRSWSRVLVAAAVALVGHASVTPAAAPAGTTVPGRPLSSTTRTTGVGAPSASATVVAAPTVAGSVTTVTSFVTRSGTRLTLDGRPFRFSGANLYWTGLDENVAGVDPDAGQSVAYPTAFRIRDGLRAARELGATVVRAHTVGISTGSPLSLEPSMGLWNPAAWGPIDLTVAEAGRLGLRLIVPLSDNGRYYHGGRYDVLRWLGLDTTYPGTAFYSDPRAIAAYQAHVAVVLNHVNPLTGRRLGDDPTIMAWELGNEMDWEIPSWVQANAAFVKTLAPRQLVAAGQSRGVQWAVTASPSVDISDSHYYPLDAAAVHADAATATAAGKVYVIGEYPSTDADDTALQSIAADPNVSGAAVWSVMPHGDHYGVVPHEDGYTLHVPGDDAAMQGRIDAIRRFGTALGQPVLPTAPTAQKPLVTSVSAPVSGVRTVRWRGTSAATSYVVSVVAAGGATTTSPSLPGSQTSWTVASSGAATVSVTGYDASGLSVGSGGLGVGTGAVVADPLEDWYLTSGRSGGVQRTSPWPAAQVAPSSCSGQGDWVSWPGPHVTSLVVTIGPSSSPSPWLEAQSSSGSWSAVPTTTRSTADGGRTLTAGVPGAAAVRVRWAAGTCAPLTRVAVGLG